MTTKLFGEPVQRVEDAKLVTGGAHFLDDLGPGSFAAAFVRSPHAHARVTDIDVTGALDVDGLVAVYTYDDLVAADMGACQRQVVAQEVRQQPPGRHARLTRHPVDRQPDLVHRVDVAAHEHTPVPRRPVALPTVLWAAP